MECSGDRVGSGWALSRHWAIGMPLAGLVTQGLSLSSFYRVRAGLLCLLFTASEKEGGFKVLTA